LSCESRLGILNFKENFMTGMFIKFEKGANAKDIKGECTDKGHEGWIEMKSYQEGRSFSSSTSHSSSGGSGNGAAYLHGLTFTKDICAASPSISESTCKGAKYNVTIHFCRGTGEERNTYYVVQAKDCVITSSSIAGEAGGFPVEHVALDFGVITWKYEQSKSDGTAASNKFVGGWDQQKGVAVAA
jgi:type VI secretion system secreted protein Hcp